MPNAVRRLLLEETRVRKQFMLSKARRFLAFS
jgi:hypothetical protein